MLHLSKTARSVCYDKPFWFEYTVAHHFFRQFVWYAGGPGLPTMLVVHGQRSFFDWLC